MAGPLWWAGPRRLALRESCPAPKMHVLEGLYIGPVDRSCLFIPREGQGDANIEDGDRRVFSWKKALLKMPQVNHTRLTIKLLRYPVRQQQILSALVKGHAPFLQARARILRRAAACVTSLCVLWRVCHHRSLSTSGISKHSDSGSLFLGELVVEHQFNLLSPAPWRGRGPRKPQAHWRKGGGKKGKEGIPHTHNL